MLIDHRLSGAALGLLLQLAGTSAIAQSTATQLPSPRAVYKCEAGGKVVYSNAPCPGARRIDVEPMRGMDTPTAKPRTGPDPSTDRRGDDGAASIKPLAGESNEQFEVRRGRFKLQLGAQRECRALDSNVPALERAEREATHEGLADVQAKLLAGRKRQRDLAC